MGTYLHGNRLLRSWDCTLQRMKRGRSLDIGEDEILNTLRVSFDNALIEEGKKCFWT